ncbi:MAG: hypothetical protein DID89_2727548385 [Candidatus Nitrotoga sp. CP45]|nr:MAG: hypothetical protein DID89_2727548385 [Candidatus Nitrotoga sp. CP45]
MKKVKSLLFISLSVFFAFPAFADTIKTIGTNTLVMCESDNPNKSPGVDFVKLYPKILITMNDYRKKGIITDTYYMQKLDEGVVFFVTNKLGDSQANADEIISKLDAIFKAGDSGRIIKCNTHTLGPKRH